MGNKNMSSSKHRKYERDPYLPGLALVFLGQLGGYLRASLRM